MGSKVSQSLQDIQFNSGNIALKTTTNKNSLWDKSSELKEKGASLHLGILQVPNLVPDPRLIISSTYFHESVHPYVGFTRPKSPQGEFTRLLFMLQLP